MKKLKYFLCLTLSAVMFSCVFAGCGGGGGSDGKTTLNVYCAMDYKNVLRSSPNDRIALMFKWIEETFEERNQDININFQNKGWGEELNTTFMRELNISGKNAPDIVIGEEYMRGYIERNVFMALDLGAELEADLIDPIKDYIAKDGKIYAVPSYVGTYGVTINKAALRNCNVIDANDEITESFKTAIAATVGDDNYRQVDDISAVNPLKPETWEDLLLICQYIKNYYSSKGNSRAGGMVMSNIKGDSQWKALAWMRTAGGDYSDSQGAPSLDTPENLKAFEMMRAFSKTAGNTGIANTTDGTQLMYANFFNNNAAYIVEGAELLARAYQYSNFRDADLATAELPVYEGREDEAKGNALVGSVYYAINAKKSENYEQSLKFIKFLLSDETQIKWYEQDRRLPVKKSILQSDAVVGEEREKRMDAFLAPITDESYSFSGGLTGFSNNAAQIWEAWTSFIAKVYGTADLASSLASTQERMLSVYNRT